MASNEWKTNIAIGTLAAGMSTSVGMFFNPAVNIPVMGLPLIAWSVMIGAAVGYLVGEVL